MNNTTIMVAEAFSIASILSAKFSDSKNKANTDIKDYSNKRRQYYIPIYQRKYNWRSDVEINKLINDLEYFWSTSKKSISKSYFLGNVVIKKDEEKSEPEIERYSVIDGQQRLTTFYLMVAALYKNGKTNNVDEQKLDELRNMIIVNENNDLLKFDNPMANIELTLIRDDALCFIEERSGSGNYFLNYEYICSKMFVKLEFSDWWEIIKRVRLSMIMLGESDDEISVFESINSDGLKLGIADLIKSYLFLLSERLNVSERHKNLIVNLYTELSEQFEVTIKNKFWDEKNVGNFLISIIHLIRRNSGFIKNERDIIYREFKLAFDQRINCSTDKQKEFVKMINEFEKYLQSYKRLISKKNKFENHEIKKDFSQHHIISTKFDNYLTMLIIQETNIDHDPQEVNKIYDLLDLHLITTSINNDKIFGKDNKYFISFLNKMFKKDSISIEYKELMSFLIGNENKNSGNLFSWSSTKEAFKTSDFYNRLKPITKYIFYKIENDFTLKNKTGEFLHWKDLTVDHIMPQDNSKWSDDSYNEEYYNSFLNSLRNLIVLKSSLNSSISNDAWEDKKNKLEKSGLSINRELLNITNNENWEMIDFKDNSTNKKWFDWILDKFTSIFEIDILKSIDDNNENEKLNLIIKNIDKFEKLTAIDLLELSFYIKNNRSMSSSNISKVALDLLKEIEKIPRAHSKVTISSEKVDSKGKYMSERLGTFTKDNNQKRKTQNPSFIKNDDGTWRMLNIKLMELKEKIEKS